MISLNIKKVSQLKRNEYKWIYLFLLPSIVVFALFNLIPIITVAITAFTEWNGFKAPSFNGLDNFVNLFSNRAFWVSAKNLLIWSALAAIVHVGFGVLIAFVLYEKPLGWKFTRSVFMIPNIISGAAWAVIFRFMFDNKMGLFNAVVRIFNPGFDVQWLTATPYAFWAVTLTWLFFAVIVTLIVLNELLAIPTSLIEAAEIDGATKWQVILKIQLPMCRKAIGTSIIASITARVTMYEAIALTTNGGPGYDTMNLPLMLVDSITNLKYGTANAVGLLMIIYGIVTLLVVNKLFKMNEEL